MGGQRSNTKKVQKPNKQFKNQSKQLKDILESIPKTPKIKEKPKAPIIKEKPNVQKITNIESSRKSYYINFDVSILDEHDPLLQLKNTESSISNFLLDTLKQMHKNSILHC